MAETFIYPRPNSAQGFYDANTIIVRPSKLVQATTPAAAAALPAVSAVVQEFTSADRYAAACVCGGTIKAIGDKFGWLMKDEKVSTAAAYALGGEVLCLLKAGANPAVGIDAYIDTTTLEVTHASGAGLQYIGYFMAGAETNPSGIPAGSYAWVILNQTEA
jgi:hypothetical protein